MIAISISIHIPVHSNSCSLFIDPSLCRLVTSSQVYYLVDLKMHDPFLFPPESEE